MKYTTAKIARESRDAWRLIAPDVLPTPGFKITRILGKKDSKEKERTDGAAKAARVAHNTGRKIPSSGATLVFQRRPGRGLFAVDRSLNRA